MRLQFKVMEWHFCLAALSQVHAVLKKSAGQKGKLWLLKPM
jgi:hypothetical protein